MPFWQDTAHAPLSAWTQAYGNQIPWLHSARAEQRCLRSASIDRDQARMDSFAYARAERAVKSPFTVRSISKGT